MKNLKKEVSIPFKFPEANLNTVIITDIEYLRQISKETTKKEVELQNIVYLIQYALHKGWVFGYGLAAVQVGIPLAVGWYWLSTDKGITPQALGEGHLLINPKILEMKEPIIKPGEGCLSIPGKTYTTKRYNRIVLMNDGHRCSAEGIEAQIIQHEVDHINGILISDREYHSEKIGRNDPCYCGSEKKYKKCCLGKGNNNE